MTRSFGAVGAPWSSTCATCCAGASWPPAWPRAGALLPQLSGGVASAGFLLSYCTGAVLVFLAGHAPCKQVLLPPQPSLLAYLACMVCRSPGSAASTADVLQCTRTLFLQRVRSHQDRAHVRRIISTHFSTLCEGRLPSFLGPNTGPDRCGVQLLPGAVRVGCARADRGSSTRKTPGAMAGLAAACHAAGPVLCGVQPFICVQSV